jgi:predicted enzyme related to lactoylglutathione lyase
MFMKIMYTTLFVTDQDKALDFYTKVFGFEKRIDFAGPEGRFLTIAFRGQDSEVLLWPGAQGRANETPGAPRSSIPGPLIIESDDLKSDFKVLRSGGVNFVETEPDDYPFGIRATAIDPDGNRVSLRQKRK